MFTNDQQDYARTGDLSTDVFWSLTGLTNDLDYGATMSGTSSSAGANTGHDFSGMRNILDYNMQNLN